MGGGSFNFLLRNFFHPLSPKIIIMARSSIAQPHVLQSSLPIHQPATTKSRAAPPRSVRLGADYGPKCACQPKFVNGIRMRGRAAGGKKEKDWPPGFEQQLHQNRLLVSLPCGTLRISEKKFFIVDMGGGFGAF